MLLSLSQLESDRALEGEVTRVFSDFGTVFVKIRRDHRGMPFAFCQFTASHPPPENSVDRLLNSNRAMTMRLRPSHTPTVPSSSVDRVGSRRPKLTVSIIHLLSYLFLTILAIFIVYKLSGMPIEAREASQFLEPFGEISRVEPLSMDVQLEMELPISMVVHFKMYDSRRDVRKVKMKVFQLTSCKILTHHRQQGGTGDSTPFHMSLMSHPRRHAVLRKSGTRRWLVMTLTVALRIWAIYP